MGNIDKFRINGTEYNIEDPSKYTKPNGGIPKSDLSEDVRASLEKADAAEGEISRLCQGVLKNVPRVSGSNDMVQLLDGETPVYPRTKGEAVFLDGDTTKTLDKVLGKTQSNPALQLKLYKGEYANVLNDPAFTEERSNYVAGAMFSTTDSRQQLANPFNVKYFDRFTLNTGAAPYKTGGIAVNRNTVNISKASIGFWLDITLVNGNFTNNAIWFGPGITTNGYIAYFLNFIPAISDGIIERSDLTVRDGVGTVTCLLKQVVKTFNGRTYMYSSFTINWEKPAGYVESNQYFIGFAVPADAQYGGEYVDLFCPTVLENVAVELDPYSYYYNKDTADIVALQEQVSEQSSEISTMGGAVERIEGKIGMIYSGLPQNIITNIATNDVGFVPLSNNNASSGINVTNVADTDSPFKDLIGKKVKFTQYNTTRNFYRWEDGSYSKSHRTERPTRIQFSCWFNKTEFDSIWNNIGVPFLSWADASVHLWMPNVKLKNVVVDGVVITIPATSSNPVFDVGTVYTVKRVFEQGDWCQVLFDLNNIVWKDSDKWEFGISLNNISVVEFGDLSIVNPQIAFNAEIPAGIFIMADGVSPLRVYPAECANSINDLTQVKADIQELQEEVLGIGSKMELVLNMTEDADSYILGDFDSNNNLRLGFVYKRSIATNHNPSFNFTNTRLVNKSTGTVTIAHSASDDICPSDYNGSYMGANHGHYNNWKCTVANHGKTYADIGSQWKDASNRPLTLIGIYDENTLLFIGANTAVYPKFYFNNAAFVTGAVFTHVSGATHTDSVAPTAFEQYQWYPAYKIIDKHIYVDGKEVTESGEYYGDRIKIVEIYKTVNIQSAVEKLQSLVGTLSANPILSELAGVDYCFQHSLVYDFKSVDECFVSSNLLALQDISLGFSGILQQGIIVGNNCKMYIPKALPISAGSPATTTDFRTIADYATDKRCNITHDYWENPALPPDRWLEYSDLIGFFGSYLFDYGVGGNNRKDLTDCAFYLAGTRKCYPWVIENTKLGDTMAAGTVYNGVGLRKYVPRGVINSNGIISQVVAEYNDALYIYADFNAVGTYEIDIPEQYLGKQVEVFEKRSNVTLLTPLSASKITIKVESDSVMYGYIVAKIKKQG